MSRSNVFGKAMLSIKVFIKVSLNSLNVRHYPLEGASLRLAPCGAPHPPLHHDFHEHCDQVRKHFLQLLKAMRPNTTDSQTGGLPRKSSNAPS